MERQVAMEEATVSGLLSTLNEEAKEDIMQEVRTVSNIFDRYILVQEINTAKEEAESVGVEGREGRDESDYLYYSHPAPSTPGPEDMLEGGRREEEGIVRCRLGAGGRGRG